MKAKLVILFIIISSYSLYAQGSTTTPYDTLGWDAPADTTSYYGLYIYRLLSNPGGYINLNTKKIDSLLNKLVVYVNPSALQISNDTLSLSDSLYSSLVDTANTNGLINDTASVLRVEWATEIKDTGKALIADSISALLTLLGDRTYLGEFTGSDVEDTIAVSGVDSLDTVVPSARGVNPQAYIWARVVNDTIFIVRSAGTVSGLKYNYIWIEK